MRRPSGAAKAAELASGFGALVLGAGLALAAPGWLRSYAVPLLVVGALVHGVGMSLTYRLQTGDMPPALWERALFWGCWASLVGLGVWMGVAALARS